MRERRRTSRQHPEDGDLGVAVRTTDGALHGGRVVRVTSEQVRIGFPVDDLPGLEDGSPVRLLFRTLSGGELTAAGRLSGHGGHHGELQLYDFVFEGAAPRDEARPEPEAGPTDPENSREAYRVRPGRERVLVRMRPLGDPSRSVLRQLTELRARGPAMTVTGWAEDLSGDGVGVVVDGPMGHAFAEEDLVDLTLTLPHSGVSLTLAARVRHRRERPAGPRYGLSFDRLSTERFQEAQQQVLELVMRLQQRNQDRAAG